MFFLFHCVFYKNNLSYFVAEYPGFGGKNLAIFLLDLILKYRIVCRASAESFFFLIVFFDIGKKIMRPFTSVMNSSSNGEN